MALAPFTQDRHTKPTNPLRINPEITWAGINHLKVKLTPQPPYDSTTH